MPDKPETYYSMPEAVKQLLTELPASWDDTKLLAGYPGEEVVIARRKGNVWYIGGINGTDEAKTLQFSLNTLGTLGTNATIIKDGADSKSFSISENVPMEKIGKDLKVDCLPRGGFTMIIK
jgi:hypothetical protein